jgi:HEAT repeat protein
MFPPHGKDGRSLADLIDRLGHPDRLERVHAGACLVVRGREDQAVVPALIAALRDERAVVRRMAALVLGDLAPQARQAVGSLVEALRHEDAGLRRRAVVALGQFGAEATAAVPALRAALADKDEGVRSFAATALTLIDPDTGQKEAA